MPRPAITVALVLAAAVAAAPAHAAPRSPTCFQVKGRTLDANADHRLFARGLSLFACRRAGRPRRLLRGYDDGYVMSRTFESPTLHGRYAAFVDVLEDISCKANCPEDYDPVTETLRVIDLRSRTAVVAEGFAGTAFVLAGTGAVAWMVEHGSQERSVVASVRGKRRELVRAMGIDPGSLEASATRVTWVQDGRVAGVEVR